MVDEGSNMIAYQKKGLQMQASNNSKSNLQKLKNLKPNLQKSIFGQDEAIDKVANILFINFIGLNDSKKPIGSFLFTGPTGVGKTELAITLSKELDMNFIRFDMSEYASKHSVYNLIGGSAGLVGYEDGGLLTNAVLIDPQSVILFDEIEKADPQVLNTLLQVMDYGILTDTKGNKVDFKQCIIIFTSNLGAISIKKRTAGFNSQIYTETENDVESFLPPEFRARISSHVHFNSLNESMMQSIIKNNLQKIAGRFNILCRWMQFDDSIVEYIIKATIDGLGARYISTFIADNITSKLSELYIFGQINKNSTIFISMDEKNIKFDINKSEQKIRDYDFETAYEAQEYAKQHTDISITRSASGNGYIKLLNTKQASRM